MPFLSKSYRYTYDNTVNATLVQYQRTRDTEPQNTANFYERSELSNTFFSHLKELLQRTNLDDVVFDNEKENTATIFNVDLKFAVCFSAANDYTNPRPIVLCPLMGTNYQNASLGQYQRYTSDIQNQSIAENGSQDISKNITYILKLYYNTNFIICHYQSAYDQEVPLFCIIKGDILNTNKHLIYIGECINYYSNKANNCALYHRLLLLDDDDTVNDYNTSGRYFPEVNNALPYNNVTNYNNNYSYNYFIVQIHYLFDENRYPKLEILTKLYTSEEYTKNVYMKKLTSWNGFVQYDNVYDVSVHCDNDSISMSVNNASNLSKIVYGTIYTINGTQYYCPGTIMPEFNSSGSLYPNITYSITKKPIYLFKL